MIMTETELTSDQTGGGAGSFVVVAGLSVK